MALDLPPSVLARAAAAQRVVASTGAGISQESGLATFRGQGGLWESRRPEELATPEAFDRDPDLVWRWYAWRWETVAAAVPNPGHLALARWETLFPSFLLVTQNVDGLHRRAGSHEPVELHGTIARARCERCAAEREMGEAVAESPERPPRCGCGGRFRPAVVWFGEALPAAALRRASEAAAACELFVSIGTSGVVYPAAGLMELAHRAGACVIEVNPEPTPLSRLADARLAAPAGVALPALTDLLAEARRLSRRSG
jgi:NAD-dependent protein deacetylase/lipoamidase